ncbi:MAG: MauE/DoxX family redox-associated membrane protein [Pseudomonadales bacterium]
MADVAPELTQALASGLLIFAAGLFASAALHKVRTFAEFTGFVSGYRLLPEGLVRLGSGVIVAAELAAIPAALGLIPGLAQLPALLLLAYAGAMGVNLLRGRNDIDCGCGGTPMPISWAAVVRNLVLAAAFGWAAALPGNAFSLFSGFSGAPMLAMTVLGFALCLGLLYAVFNQLEANHATRRRLWEQAA